MVRATPTSITIRPGTAADVDTIHRALHQLGEHVGETHKIRSTPDDLRRYGFGADPQFRVVIAEGGGLFAGMCLFFGSFSTWIGRPGVYVQDLIVDRDFRGQGIGERLIREVARIAQAEGGAYMRLSVDVENLSAQAFYDRIGMELVKDDMIRAAYGEAFEALAREEDR